MYDNIGRKIMNLAKTLCIIEAVVAVIIGIALAASDSVGIGLLVTLFGPIVAWISSFLMYGFGELVEKVSEIARNTYGSNGKSEAQSRAYYERLRKIEKLRTQGLITEEEYQQLISNEQ